MSVRNGIRTAGRRLRTLLLGLVGASVVAVGVAMLVLPGPAFVVIPAGLAILGLEFEWARRWLALLRERAGAASERLRRSR
jgi:tellurite resistance protein TerC